MCEQFHIFSARSIHKYGRKETKNKLKRDLAKSAVTSVKSSLEAEQKKYSNTELSDVIIQIKYWEYVSLERRKKITWQFFYLIEYCTC